MTLRDLLKLPPDQFLKWLRKPISPNDKATFPKQISKPSTNTPLKSAVCLVASEKT